MDADLRHLRYFVAVAEELHFGHAARRLFLSQPSLSSQIRQLEERVGVTLLERTTREVRLTPAGAVLLERARTVLAGFDAAVEAAREAAGVLKGVLNVRCSYGGQHLAEPRLADFRRAHPDVTVNVLLGHDGELVEALRRGEADAAFLWEFDDDTTLETLLVGEEPAGVVVPEGHRLADFATVPRGELAAERLVLFEREAGPAIVRRLERLVWGEREPPEDQIVRIDVATGAQEAHQEAVAAGAGISFVARWFFDAGHPPGIVFRPLDPPFAARLFVVWPPTRAPVRDAFIARLAPLPSD